MPIRRAQASRASTGSCATTIRPSPRLAYIGSWSPSSTRADRARCPAASLVARRLRPFPECPPGRGRSLERKVRLLVEVEPDEGLHLRVVGEVSEHAGNPGGLAASGLGAPDLGEIDRERRCERVQLLDR